MIWEKTGDFKPESIRKSMLLHPALALTIKLLQRSNGFYRSTNDTQWTENYVNFNTLSITKEKQK